MSGASGTPSACSTSPTRPCIRSTRSQRSASSSRECAKPMAVPARPSTIAASCESLIFPPPASVIWDPDRRMPAATRAVASVVDGCLRRGISVQPLAHRHVTRCAFASGALGCHLAEQPRAFGDDVVLMDRLEVLLAAHDEGVRLEPCELLEGHADLLADAVLDEPRTAVRALDDCEFVRALHQLENLRAHRLFDDPQQVRPVDLAVAALGAADPQRADSALVVGRHWHVLEDALHLVIGEAVGQQTLARRSAHHFLRARTGSHALRGDADEPTGAGRGRDRGAVQRVDLLCRYAAHGCGLVLGVARCDVHLCAQALLAFAHEFCDVRGQRLRLERLAEDDMLDRFVDRLFEARHVSALLARVEVDEALELRVEQLWLRAFGAYSYHLLDPGYSNARKAHVGRGTPRLNVLHRQCSRRRHSAEDSCRKKCL